MPSIALSPSTPDLTFDDLGLPRKVIAALVLEDIETPTPVQRAVIPDALAGRDYHGTIRLLEDKRARGAANRDDIFLLTYLYCLNGDVGKAESIATATTDWERPLVKWLWGKLQAEYGFRPPTSR